jgi:DNA replication protein DnaC
LEEQPITDPARWRLWLEQHGTWPSDQILDIGARYLARNRGGTNTGLLIIGNVGCGKTYLMKLIARKIEHCEWIEASRLPALYKADEEAFRDRIENRRFSLMDVDRDNQNRVYTPSALIIDDIGAETKCNNYGAVVEPIAEALAIRSSFRDEWQQPLLMTSNLPLSHPDPNVVSITSRYGERTVSRIRGLCWIVNAKGGDRRGQDLTEL